jgi:hypothetical protein
MKKPKVIAYDLEFANNLPDNDWRRMTECGVGVLASWSSEESEPRVWIPDEGGHVWKNFAKHALNHDVALTYNGMECDDLMIYAEFPLWERVLGAMRRVDLILLAGLYSLADKKGIPRRQLSDVLQRGIPNNYPQLVGYKPTATLNVKSGWAMGATFQGTFGESGKGMPGEEAPIRWQAGRRGEVIGYCVGDAYRLMRLWEHSWQGNPLKNLKGGIAKIPQVALGGSGGEE